MLPIINDNMDCDTIKVLVSMLTTSSHVAINVDSYSQLSMCDDDVILRNINVYPRKVFNDLIARRGCNVKGALQRALWAHRVDIIISLISNNRVDPSANDDALLKWAVANKYADLVIVLLKDSRVDPSVDSDAAVKWASDEGHTTIIAMLLKDSRVDPSAGDDESIKWASMRGYTDIVVMLLTDDRVRGSLDNGEVMKWAMKGGHADIASLLTLAAQAA